MIPAFGVDAGFGALTRIAWHNIVARLINKGINKGKGVVWPAR
jgi:hypothetical protein